MKIDGIRWTVWAAVLGLLVLVIGFHTPANVANWMAQRAFYEADAKNADAAFQREQKLRVQWQTEGKQLAQQIHGLERGDNARHVAANRAIAHATPDCRRALAPVIVERDSLRKEVLLAERQHQNDLHLIVSWQYQDSVEHALRQRAETLLKSAPIRPSFWSVLLHPRLQAGIGPAWTWDDQRLHPLGVTLALGWAL